MTGEGLLVSFEGPEASGKSTAMEHLTRMLVVAGVQVLPTREPGGTPTGKQIRSILLDDAVSPTAKSEFLLFQADRAQHVHEVILPAINAGRVVLSDRYILSSLAYQVGGRDLPEEDALQVIRFATDGLIPDLTVLLTVQPDIATARLKGRGGRKDRIESEEIAFHTKVYAAYKKLLGGHLAKNWLHIDTSHDWMTPEVVARMALDRILTLLGEKS